MQFDFSAKVLEMYPIQFDFSAKVFEMLPNKQIDVSAECCF